MNVTDFPALLSGSNSGVAALSDAIDAFVIGIERGEIANVDFNDAKDRLNRGVYDATRRAHEAFHPLHRSGAFDALPDAVKDVSWYVTASSVHDLRSAKKRADRARAAGVDHPAAVAVLDCIDQLHPLVALLDAAKPLIIKRRPMTDAQRLERAQRENPDKIIRTCGYCCRHIAVGPGGYMVHHGYQRPGTGTQTQSCPGIHHAPWERSKGGGEALLADLIHDLKLTERYLKRLGTATTLETIEIDRDRSFRKVTLTRGTPEFARHVEHESWRTQYHRDSLVTDIERTTARVEAWVQVEKDVG